MMAQHVIGTSLFLFSCYSVVSDSATPWTEASYLLQFTQTHVH